MKKIKEYISLIVSSSALVSTLIFVGYKVYGQDLVRADATEIQKPLVKKVVKLEKTVKKLETAHKKSAENIEFIKDMLYEMNPRAFRKVKKARKEKNLD